MPVFQDGTSAMWLKWGNITLLLAKSTDGRVNVHCTLCSWCFICSTIYNRSRITKYILQRCRWRGGRGSFNLMRYQYTAADAGAVG